MKKATFLANSINKQRFINMLSGYLEKKYARRVTHAVSDTDLLIAQKAVESSSTSDTVLVGDDTCRSSCFDDTDLLVLSY